MRPFRLFFLPSPSAGAGFEVFFAAFDSVVFAGAFEAVEAGAFPAVEAGLGAIAIIEIKVVVGGSRVVERQERVGGGSEEKCEREQLEREALFIRTRGPFVWSLSINASHANMLHVHPVDLR